MAQAAGGRVYGTALAESAQSAGRLHEVARDLAAIGSSVKESHTLASALLNPAFPDAAKKAILAQMSEGADPLVRNALFVLVDNDRLDALVKPAGSLGALEMLIERWASITGAAPPASLRAGVLDAGQLVRPEARS